MKTSSKIKYLFLSLAISTCYAANAATWTIDGKTVTDGNWVLNQSISDNVITLSGYASGSGFLDLSTLCNDIGTTGVKIGQDLFYQKKIITGIALPEELVSIGRRAFRDSSLGGSISCSSSFKLEGGDAFAQTAITSVYFPNIEGVLQTWTFYGCKSLESIVLSDKLTSFGGSVMSECNNLVSLTPTVFPLVKEITGDIFKNSKLLEIDYLSFPLVESIPKECFHSLTKIKEIHLPSCNSIGKSAFYSYGGNKITLAPVVTNVDEYAFGATKITELSDTKFALNVLNKGVFAKADQLSGVLDFSKSTFTILSDSAFEQAKKLERVILPETVTQMNYRAFSHNGRLEVVFLGPRPTYNTDDLLYPASNNVEHRTSIVTPKGNIASWTNASDVITFVPMKDVPESEKTDSYYYPTSGIGRVIGVVYHETFKTRVSSWLSILNEFGTIVIVK